MASEGIDLRELSEAEAALSRAAVDLEDIVKIYESNIFSTPEEKAKLSEAHEKAVQKRKAAEDHIMDVTRKYL